VPIDLIAASGPARGRVLDLACGGGQFLFTLAERIPQLELVGLDASRDMLELCRARAAASATPERFSFIQGDMTDLCAIPDGAFSLTTWTYAAHHTRDLAQVAATLREMARVTAPDGAMLVLDLGRLKTPALNAWYVSWAGRSYSPGLLAEFRDSMNAAYTAGELRGLVETVGIPGLRHYAAAGLPVLQILYRPPRIRTEGEARVAELRPQRSPAIMRDYKQLSLLFRLGGLEPGLHRPIS
jgi:SAM-dependent methyltransferase